MRSEENISIRRLALAIGEPHSTVGRWVSARDEKTKRRRPCPVSGDPEVRRIIRSVCDEPRFRTFGYRRIWAVLRTRNLLRVNKKAVWRAMHDMGLTQKKIWRRPMRPKRVKKMRPGSPNQAWQIDQTSLYLSDMTPLYLVLVTDCYTREIVGWTLDRRCRASEWIAAVRMGLEAKGLNTKEKCAGLTLRSDNGAQPCSRAFTTFISKVGVRGEYTGYNAPDDNAYVERLIRTLKEEEIWPNLYDSIFEALEAIENYVKFYNEERVHSSLDYRTPKQFAASQVTLVAA